MTIAPIPGANPLSLVTKAIPILGDLFGGGGPSVSEQITSQWMGDAFRDQVQQHRFRNRFKYLQQDARKAGINPLTALMAGNPMSPSVPNSTGPIVAPSSPGLMTTATSLLEESVAGNNSTETAENTRRRADSQLDQIEKDKKTAGAAGKVVDETEEVLSAKPKLGMENVRPKAWADGGPLARGSVRVFGIGGAPIELSRAHMDRLNGGDIGPGGQLIVEDYEGLFGDEGGQILAVPQVPRAHTTAVGDEGSNDSRADALDNPWSLKSFFLKGAGESEEDRRKPPVYQPKTKPKRSKTYVKPKRN